MDIVWNALGNSENLYPAVQRNVVRLGMGNECRVKCTGSLYLTVQRVVLWQVISDAYRVECIVIVSPYPAVQ